MIEAAAAGDALATERLFPIVYAELRRMAGGLMNQERSSHTLQPTALVNEAYLKLLGGEDRGWDTRAHFFGAAARAMRCILIDYARKAQTKRREAGDPADMTGLPTLASGPAGSNAAAQLLAVDVALDTLIKRDRRQHDVVMLRFFGGLSIEQTALALGISAGTVKNDWTYARAWLMREIDRANHA